MSAALPHTVRIIGGKYKGKQLAVVDAEGLRPTPDRVRETVFNLIGRRTEGAIVLDLFAGSGALGFEAVSRGAHSLVLVENNPDNFDNLEEEAHSFAGAQIEVVHQDAVSYLKNCIRQFDLVFLDPPYKSALLQPSLELLISRDLITPDCLLYVEMSSTANISVPGYEILREETAGQVRFGLWRRSSFLL